MHTPRTLQNKVARYRSRLLSNDIDERRAIARTLIVLASTQHSYFIEVCHLLMDDPAPRVRNDVLWHLYRNGDRDDGIAESKARTALAEPALRGRALLALGTVGTAAAVPLLYEHCLADESEALVSLARQVRTEAERQEALRLSRVWLSSPVYWRRDEALMALRAISTAGAEEETLMATYRIYADGLVAWALGAASTHVLPFLEEQLERYSGFVEGEEIERAIRRLRRRLDGGEAADRAAASENGCLYLFDEYL